MKYAYIENGKVADIAKVDPFGIFQPAYAEQFIEAPDEVEAGWLYDGQVFTAPPPLPPAYPRFFGNAKLDLFSPEEQIAVVTATMTDPIVKLVYDRLIGAAYLSYEDPETEHGLALIESRGLIVPARKAEIVQAMQPT